MGKSRVEAFSDGVIAILITIMVLELRPPEEPTLEALFHHEGWVFLAYILSFVIMAIYWNNHHHLFQVVERVNGKILWANMHLLLWLSLIPFATAWMGRTGFGVIPLAVYGLDMSGASVAFWILLHTLIAHHGPRSRLAAAVQRDNKGKISLLLNVLGIPLAFVSRPLSAACYVAVAVIWLIPDRRMERNLGDFARHSSE